MVRHYQLKPQVLPSRLGIPYEKDLNEQQLAVVTAPDGPNLVIAGAGSGKTRVLTYRVAYLLDRGVSPNRIMLLTFTNRAARQMLDRAGQLCGAQARAMLGGTFHHVANVILRDHAQAVGYQPNFTILDQEDAKEMLTAAIGDAHIDVKARRFPKADVVLDLISRTLNEQKPLADVIAAEAPHFLSVQAEIMEVARCYLRRKLAQNVMDFDDLLMNFKVLLQEGGEVARAVQSRFEHVLVDEYQDTNKLQGDIVDGLVAPHQNVMVVGDDAQAIYGFRGAHFDNILGFPNRHPGARMYRLEVNYRSTPQILDLANASIRKNRARFDKTLRSLRPHGPQPALVPTRDVFEQAAFVAQRILELRDEGVGLRDMSVLYRAHSHALELQVELTRRGIPFVVRSGLRFFEQAHIKDVLSYLRFIQNPSEELALRRALKLHEGVGNALAQGIWEKVQEAQQKGEEVREGRFFVGTTVTGAPRAKQGLAVFARIIDQLMNPAVKDSPQEMIRVILDEGYRDYLRKTYPNSREREVDIEQLGDYSVTFGSLEEMLSEISLMESVSSEDVLSAEEADEKLTLSSVHQAKGLEWGRVFIIWLADGRIPHDVALRDLDGEEEERRLFYVACTRAKDELYLVYPTVHQRRDRALTIMRPSRFLTELGDTEATDARASLLWERWQLHAEPPQIIGAMPPPPALVAGPWTARADDDEVVGEEEA
ncbi:MAG: ATP-dependent helicase [Myxococcota bacterium]